MEFDLRGVSPAELQSTYVLSLSAPLRKPYQRGEYLEYFFEFCDIRLGLIELFHDTTNRHVCWSLFYPLCVQLTEAEVRKISAVKEALIRAVGMDFLRHNLCDISMVPKGLEGHGLGTLAHTLVTRHLCRQLLAEPESYTTSYFSKRSIAPRLADLLRRAGVEAMMETPVSLMSVQDKLTARAQQEFGFRFEDSSQ
jgi:hypothetical protein